MGARVGGAVLDQPAAEARLQAAGERDHALGVAVEQLHVDVRLAAREALEEAGRGELDEVAEAACRRPRAGSGGCAPTRPSIASAVVDQVGLEPEDRLDPVLAAGLVVLDRAVHHPVVGERRAPACRARPRAAAIALDLAGAVEQRVLAVDVQVDRRSRSPIRSSQPRSVAIDPPELANCDDPGRDLAAAPRRRRGLRAATTPRAG